MSREKFEVEKPWEKKLLPLTVIVLALFLSQAIYSQPPEMNGGVFIFTEPSGAMISMPQAGSIRGYHVKPLVKSPGPLPLNLKERSRFTFFINLPGYEQETLRLTPEELEAQVATIKLSPTVPYLVTLLYFFRDWCFVLAALGAIVVFAAFVVLPQQKERRAQKLLWRDHKMKPGMRFHGYHLLKELGEGGAGLVFLAERPDDGGKQLYALKSLHEGGKDEQNLREELERECKACARLEHPGIVRLYDWGQVEDFFYLVFEFVEGATLDEFYTGDPVLVCDWASQIVTALRYAHGKGIVHRDLKPANIVLDKHGFAKILDFGISASMEDEFEGSSGTMGYMAPEQASGVVSPACDYYSLGVTLYHLLSGEPPFAGDDFFQVLASQSQSNYLPLRERRADLPEGFSELLDELLKVDPKQRLQDPDELLSRLSKIRESFSSSAD